MLSHSQVIWRKQFDIHFSVEWISETEIVDWRQEFIKEFMVHKSFKDNVRANRISVGSPAVCISKNTCGKVVQQIEDIPNYRKFKVLLDIRKFTDNDVNINPKAITSTNYIVYPSMISKPHLSQPQ